MALGQVCHIVFAMNRSIPPTNMHLNSASQEAGNVLDGMSK